jgi:hypothetical protein
VGVAGGRRSHACDESEDCHEARRDGGAHAHGEAVIHEAKTCIATRRVTILLDLHLTTASCSPTSRTISWKRRRALRQPAKEDKAFVVCPLAFRLHSNPEEGSVWNISCDLRLLSSLSPLATSRHHAPVQGEKRSLNVGPFWADRCRDEARHAEEGHPIQSDPSGIVRSGSRPKVWARYRSTAAS